MPLLANYEKYLPLLQKGYYYAYGRDKAMRPIIYFNGRRWLDEGANLDEMIITIDLVNNYLIEKAMVPGRVEAYQTIVDMEGVSLTEIPVSSLKDIIYHLRDGYIARASSLSIVNVPYMI